MAIFRFQRSDPFAPVKRMVDRLGVFLTNHTDHLVTGLLVDPERNHLLFELGDLLFQRRDLVATLIVCRLGVATFLGDICGHVAIV